MRTSHPHSILHLHSEGAAAVTYTSRPDGSRKPHFFYQSPKATGSLEMALKRFFQDSQKDHIYINVVSSAATLSTFKDTTLLKEPEAFIQVLEASSGIADKDCDAIFLDAKTGAPFEGKGPLLVNCFKRSDFLRAQAIASELGFSNFKLFNNTLSTLGAISEWRNDSGSVESVAFLEVGGNASTLTLALADGQISTKRVPVSMQDIAEAIQKKLQLKFESAALLLFCNGVFDFGQHQAAISKIFADRINPHLQNLAGKLGRNVDRLLITSLPPSYAWINEEVPKCLGIRGFSVDDFHCLKDIKTLGNCATNAGFVGVAFCAHSNPESDPWMVSMEMQSIQVACRLSKGHASAPVIDSPEAEVQALEATLIADQPETQVENSKKIEPTVFEPIEEPPFATNYLKPKKQGSASDIFDEPEDFIIEEPKDEPIQVITFNEKKQKDTPKPKTVSPIQEEEEKSKLGLIFGSLVAIFLIGLGAYVYFQNIKPAPIPVPIPLAQISENQAIDPLATRTVDNKEAVKTASTAQQTIARPSKPVNRELESMEHVDAQASTAETEIAAIPVKPVIPKGILEINSTPLGAVVILNGETKGKTPLTVEELEFGQYTIEFKLAGYVPGLLDVSVQTEDPLTVSSELKLPFGTLEIQTTPEGVAFDVISVAGLDRVVHSGVTPATIKDILKGDYEVTFKRHNWDNYSERVQIRYNDVSRVDLVYPEGWLMVNSTPANASVYDRGQFVGKTPIRLKGLKEGEKSYTIRLDGYEDLETNVTIVAQTEKTIHAELLNWDREVNYSELEIPPTQTKQTLSNTQRLVGNDAHRFLVEFVINKEGIPEQIEVLETTYLRAHDRLKKDISNWVFEPGMRKDRAVKTRVRLPIILGDASQLPPAVELARTVKNDDE